MKDTMEERLRQVMGPAIKAVRAGYGITQEEAAEQIGITVEHYARIERGRALPSLSAFARICVVMDVSADVLLARSEGPARAGAEPPRWFVRQGPTDSKQVQRLYRRLRTRPPEFVAALEAVLRQLDHFADRRGSDGDDDWDAEDDDGADDKDKAAGKAADKAADKAAGKAAGKAARKPRAKASKAAKGKGKATPRAKAKPRGKAKARAAVHVGDGVEAAAHVEEAAAAKPKRKRRKKPAPAP